MFGVVAFLCGVCCVCASLVCLLLFVCVSCVLVRCCCVCVVVMCCDVVFVFGVGVACVFRCTRCGALRFVSLC